MKRDGLELVRKVREEPSASPAHAQTDGSQITLGEIGGVFQLCLAVLAAATLVGGSLDETILG